VFDIYAMLEETYQRGGTDLHLIPGEVPRVRVLGRLVPCDEVGALSPEETRRICEGLIPEGRMEEYRREKTVDFSFSATDKIRIRANIFHQRKGVEGAFRVLPKDPIPLEELGLPTETVKGLLSKPRGLILVTGPTGSGKTTTLAGMVDWLNRTYPKHILTIEDPVEYVIESKKGIVTQREVGTHVPTFHDALKYILRQDPDVALVGEMRDLDSIFTTLTIAETGHLTLATLHTNLAVETINRVIGVFPAHQQAQVRYILSFVLLGVISQMLIPTPKGLVLASEVLIATSGVKNLIREGKVHQIQSLLETESRHGSRSMKRSLQDLMKRGVLTKDMVANFYGEEVSMPFSKEEEGDKTTLSASKDFLFRGTGRRNR